MIAGKDIGPLHHSLAELMACIIGQVLGFTEDAQDKIQDPGIEMVSVLEVLVLMITLLVFKHVVGVCGLLCVGSNGRMIAMGQQVLGHTKGVDKEKHQ